MTEKLIHTNQDQEGCGFVEKGNADGKNVILNWLKSIAPQPQQPYGKPFELPVSKIPESLKHHIKRSGR